jgi:ABC-type transporter Mla subunit MlaD
VSCLRIPPQNVNAITTEANTLISSVGPDVQNIVGSAKHVVSNVENTALQVTDTVGLVTDSVADTALNLKHNVSSAQDYLVFVTEVADIVRAWIRK